MICANAWDILHEKATQSVRGCGRTVALDAQPRAQAETCREARHSINLTATCLSSGTPSYWLPFRFAGDATKTAFPDASTCAAFVYALDMSHISDDRSDSNLLFLIADISRYHMDIGEFHVGSAREGGDLTCILAGISLLVNLLDSHIYLSLTASGLELNLTGSLQSPSETSKIISRVSVMQFSKKIGSVYSPRILVVPNEYLGLEVTIPRRGA